MSLSHPDRPRRGSLFALLLVGAGGMLSAQAADVRARVGAAEIQVEGRGLQLGPDTMSLRDLTLTQKPDLLIKAQQTQARGVESGGYENSTWDLKGTVHIEMEGAVLDADSAKVVFADGRVKTIHVQGAPSRFSHVMKNTERRYEGRAAVIDYDAAAGLVRSSGGTKYAYGRSQGTTEAVVTYNLTSGVLSTQGDGSDNERVRLTLDPVQKDPGQKDPIQKVPAPRAPDRTSAK